MTREELYQWLKQNHSEVYDVEFVDNNGKKSCAFLSFFEYNGSYFECPLEIRQLKMTEEELKKYMLDEGGQEYVDNFYEKEKKKIIGDYYYETDYPQCFPFIKIVESITPITEEEAVRRLVAFG